MTQYGNGFLRVALHELADLLHRLLMCFAEYLRGLDELRRGDDSESAFSACFSGAGGASAGAAGATIWIAFSSGVITRRTSGRTTKSNTRRPRISITPISTERMMSSVVKRSMRHKAGVSHGLRDHGGFREAQVHDFDHVAALVVEADCRADKGRDALKIFFGARCVGQIVAGLRIGAVNEHRDRDALHAARLQRFGARGAGDFVIHDFFGLARIVARLLRLLLLLLIALIAGKFVRRP